MVDCPLEHLLQDVPLHIGQGHHILTYYCFINEEIKLKYVAKTNTDIFLGGVLQHRLYCDRHLCNLRYICFNSLYNLLLVIFVVNSNLLRIFESYLHINLKDFLVTGLELDDRHLATENFLFLKCFPGSSRCPIVLYYFQIFRICNQDLSPGLLSDFESKD